MQLFTRASRIITRPSLFTKSLPLARTFGMSSRSLTKSVRVGKLIALGTFGVVSAFGVSTLVLAQDKQEEKEKVEEQLTEEERKIKELEPPPTFNLNEEEDDENDPELKEYNPWFRGVKEISVFLDKESMKVLDEQFPQILQKRHANRVTLVLNPKDEESNSYAMYMQEETPIKVIGMVQDKHVTVLMVDLPTVRSLYEYPCIILDCEGDDDTHAYSEAYGRLLLDRAFKGGMFSMENNHYILKEKTQTKVLEDYYTYPETEVTGIDLRDKNIELKGIVCTRRGWNQEDCKCTEPVHQAECGWCVFMKGGPCWREFIKWQRCISSCDKNSSTDDFISKCGLPTLRLKECVDKNPDYYGEIAQTEDTNQEEKIIEVDPNEGKEQENVTYETPKEVVETTVSEFTSEAPKEVVESTNPEPSTVEHAVISDEVYEASLEKDMQ